MTKKVEVTMLKMSITDDGFIKLQEQVVIDATKIKQVYTAIPFRRDAVVYKERKLTDKVHNYTYTVYMD